LAKIRRKETSRMKRVPPSEKKRQALQDWLAGKQILEEKQPWLSQLIRLSAERTLQEFLEAEQAEYLGRARYQRAEGEPVYRNGYEAGTLKTGEGVLRVEKPQLRGLEQPYRSQLWERFQHSSEQLRQLVMEMYVLGMSQRDIEQALEKSLGEFLLSRQSVSQIARDLSEEYEAFKRRDLSGFEVAYLFIDTVYEPLRQYGAQTGVTCCWAILSSGSKVLLDLTVSNTESYAASLEFLRGMVKRGLGAPLSVTTDGAAGLIKAVEKVWPKSRRIRCWFHKMQNLEQKVSEAEWKTFKAELEDVRDAPSLEKAQQRRGELIQRYHSRFPEACRCLQDDGEASLNHLHFPLRHRGYIRTTNLIERTFVEERRRTKTIPHLGDQASLLRLVFAVFSRVSERWGKRQFNQFEQKKLRQLKQETLGGKPVKVKAARPQFKRRSAARAA
jgi:putative transposase